MVGQGGKFGICSICPRECNADREEITGYCSMKAKPVVAKAYLHMWEEPCISGNRGSGTVFFSGCNLKCLYCQNYKISQENYGKELSVEKLAQVYLSLQEKGAHNINLVNPTHFVKQIRESISMAEALKIPVVYNSNGYESIQGLKLMENIADVYLPDLKYYNSDISRKYSGAPDYFEVATKAILEMGREVGMPIFDEEGIIKKGIIIRHLILPGLIKESFKILDWIKANFSGEVFISLMSQYTPYYKAECFPEINRRITKYEYEKVVDHLYKLGFQNGYIQERNSAEEEYIPDFDLQGI
jgi:putative pyruvate formate lyase activating enzyme